MLAFRISGGRGCVCRIFEVVVVVKEYYPLARERKRVRSASMVLWESKRQ
jgi:hypothetical protein